MSNTKTDEYIETLHAGMEIEMEVGTCVITGSDQYSCTVRDDNGDEYEYTWGQVAEHKDLIDAENQANDQVDFMRDHEPC